MSGRAASRRVKRRRRALVLLAAAAVAVGATVAGVSAIAATLSKPATAASASAAPDSASATPEPAPAAEPLDPASALLAATDAEAGTTVLDACAVSFTGTGIALDPQLQRSGQRYAGLPIPTADGLVFAGWYPTEADAAAFTREARVNGADLVGCGDRRVTLYGAWQTPDQVAAADVGVPILMYHQFTSNPAGEDNSLRLNYIYTGDFDAQMAYLAQQQFYLPTWDEMDAFLDGRLSLPDKSVVITDDDADITWLTLGVPIIDKYGLLTTSFVITVFRSEPTPSLWVQQRSHTHDMHRAGSDGQGRITTLPLDEIVADLTTSAEILGAREVVAYPFGHNNAQAQEGVAEAGYTMAVTIEGGYARPGENKLALPRQRINYGTTLDEFIGIVG